jgi:chromosome segregation ATPase
MTDDARTRLELENRRVALTELHRALVEAERRAAGIDQQIEQLEHEHAVELAARAEALHHIEARVARLEHELRVAVHERNTFEWERDSARAERDALRDQLEALRSSRAYRWAAAMIRSVRPVKDRGGVASP